MLPNRLLGTHTQQQVAAMLPWVALVLWPIVCLLMAVHHSLSKQWAQTVRLMPLVLVWAMAPLAIMSLTLVPRPGDGNAFLHDTLAVLALVAAFVSVGTAWWLLLTRNAPSREAQPSACCLACQSTHTGNSMRAVSRRPFST